ncbi:hypothetical protein MJ564_18135 [Escherichia coli]|nr:hypothetical protein MJ564_18135 [Escherichia coli]
MVTYAYAALSGVSNGNNLVCGGSVCGLPADFARVASSLARFLTPDKPLRITFGDETDDTYSRVPVNAFLLHAKMRFQLSA